MFWKFACLTSACTVYTQFWFSSFRPVPDRLAPLLRYTDVTSMTMTGSAVSHPPPTTPHHTDTRADCSLFSRSSLVIAARHQNELLYCYGRLPIIIIECISLTRSCRWGFFCIDSDSAGCSRVVLLGHASEPARGSEEALAVCPIVSSAGAVETSRLQQRSDRELLVSWASFPPKAIPQQTCFLLRFLYRAPNYTLSFKPIFFIIFHPIFIFL